MKKITALFLTLFTLAIPYQIVFAEGEPPVNPTSVGTTANALSIGGFPWALILVFMAAGYIITTIKKNTPANTITTSCCIPLIDEKKMEAEKKKIAEEEASLRNS